MSHLMTSFQRHIYLAQHKAQMFRRLCWLLEGLTPADMVALTPAQRDWFVDVLARMPEEIPADLLAPLQAALAITEVAA